MNKSLKATPAKLDAPTTPSPSTEKSNPVALADASFAELAGAGLENVGANDLIIPRLTILQSLSPQINSRKPEFIDGAKTGEICDVGTGEIFEPPLQFLPVHYLKQWLEWAPRATGKGLVKIHSDADILEACTRDEKNRPFTKDGNRISETAQFFGLNMSAGGRRCFLPMASTQLKKAKRWLTLSTSEKAARADGSNFTPPLFYRLYELSVMEEDNVQGSWLGWKIERGLRLQDFSENWNSIMKEAIEFRESIKKGAVRGEVAPEEETDAEGRM